MGRLQSQVILVSGGADALGRAVIERCLDEGAHPVLLEADGARAAGLAGEFGDALLVVEGDPATPAAQRRALDATLARHGTLHGYVGHSACWDGDLTLAELPGDERLVRGFHALFAANVLACLSGARVVAAALAREHGSMVFTLAAAALRAGQGGPLATAAAHAGAGLVRALAAELAPRVRVNGVCVSRPPASLHGPFGSTAAGAVPVDLLRPQYLPDPWAQADAYIKLLARHGAPATTGTLVETDGDPVDGLVTLA